MNDNPFERWLAIEGQGQILAKALIRQSAKPDMARAILEIGFVEGCVVGAEAVAKRVGGGMVQHAGVVQ